MNRKENYVEFSIQEAVDFFSMPKDIGDFGKCVIASYEFILDFTNQQISMCVARTPPISEEEICMWKEACRQLDEMDWEGAYSRVKIERQLSEEYDV